METPHLGKKNYLESFIQLNLERCVYKSIWLGGGSAPAGLFSTMTMQVSSVDADAAALLSRWLRNLSPKFSGRAGQTGGGAVAGAAARGRVMWALGIYSSS